MVEKVSSCSNALPVPIATHVKGSSAIWTGSPVSLENLLSIFFNKAPPPVKVKPISTKSADNSGGVFSNASFMPSTIYFKIPLKASDESSSVILTSLGVPDLKSLPLTG